MSDSENKNAPAMLQASAEMKETNDNNATVVNLASLPAPVQPTDGAEKPWQLPLENSQAIAAPHAASAFYPRRAFPNQKGAGREGYIWQDKAIILRILDQLGTRATNGLAVYLGLTRISGELKNAHTFKSSISRIASMAGMRWRTAHKTLHELQSEAGVIRIETSKANNGIANDKSTYTLLQVLHTPPPQDLHSPLCKRRPPLFAESKTYNIPTGDIISSKEKDTGSAPPAGLRAGGAQHGDAQTARRPSKGKGAF